MLRLNTDRKMGKDFLKTYLLIHADYYPKEIPSSVKKLRDMFVKQTSQNQTNAKRKKSASILQQFVRKYDLLLGFAWAAVQWLETEG